MFKRIALVAGLLIGAAFTVTLVPSTSATEVCQVAGVNDDGGYIDCAEFTGPARVTGQTFDTSFNKLKVSVDILVNDETPIRADVWFTPFGQPYAVLLYDEAGEMFGYGMTRPAGSPLGVDIPTEATASYGATLDLYAPCTFEFDQGPHWCR